ncbi:hypothetical protein PR048_007790 [Dryococelus australis]|uniref:SWIM-type domain-containing protein n=1 Tax=Dryococelus australis TaxID=614101 RepID=A0ABQ9HV90_9NEOP|nr:hypothetical protein PR048_007790 [Dryococelus australis]
MPDYTTGLHGIYRRCTMQAMSRHECVADIFACDIVPSIVFYLATSPAAWSSYVQGRLQCSGRWNEVGHTRPGGLSGFCLVKGRNYARFVKQALRSHVADTHSSSFPAWTCQTSAFAHKWGGLFVSACKTLKGGTLMLPCRCTVKLFGEFAHMPDDTCPCDKGCWDPGRGDQGRIEELARNSARGIWKHPEETSWLPKLEGKAVKLEVVIQLAWSWRKVARTRVLTAVGAAARGQQSAPGAALCRAHISPAREPACSLSCIINAVLFPTASPLPFRLSPSRRSASTAHVPCRPDESASARSLERHLLVDSHSFAMEHLLQSQYYTRLHFPRLFEGIPGYDTVSLIHRDLEVWRQQASTHQYILVKAKTGVYRASQAEVTSCVLAPSPPPPTRDKYNVVETCQCSVVARRRPLCAQGMRLLARIIAPSSHSRPHDGGITCKLLWTNNYTLLLPLTAQSGFRTARAGVGGRRGRRLPPPPRPTTNLPPPPPIQNTFTPGAKVAERLARSPPTKANRVQSPAGSPDFRKWESCWTMSLVGGFSRGSPISLVPSFR